ncbi:MAG: hypothetical protein HOC20_13570 [Chloroflexi bacterium]|jgi:hypothetical protein|nr:hypothetical protein [Chloroflexota bacterium]
MIDRRCLLIFITMLSMILVFGCVDSDSDGGFAIYSPKQEMTIDELAIVSHIEVSEDPIISADDIISYSEQTHEITLTPDAAERIYQLELPGKPFVVCVDRQPIYAGAFMAAYFSRTFDGVVIETLGVAERQSLRIQLGYPESQDLYTGDDPRSDPTILRALKSDGKLQ